MVNAPFVLLCYLGFTIPCSLFSSDTWLPSAVNYGAPERGGYAFLQFQSKSNFKILQYAFIKLGKKHCYVTLLHLLYYVCTHIYCRQSILGTDNTRDNSIYNCSISVYGFLLMCSLVFLCWALSPRRLWSGENCLCLLQHTSKRALLRKEKVLGEPTDCLPIMHRCILDRTIFREIYSAAGMDNTLALTIPSVTKVWKWLKPVCFFSLPLSEAALLPLQHK